MTGKEFTDTFLGTSNSCLTVDVYHGSDNVEVQVDGHVITVPKTWFINAASKINDTMPERWNLFFGKSFEDAMITIAETPRVEEMVDVVSPEIAEDIREYDGLITLARKLVAAERKVDDQLKAESENPNFPVETYRRKRSSTLERISRMRKIGIDRVPEIIFRNERIIMAIARARYYYPDDRARLERLLALFDSELQEPNETKKETIQ